MIWQTFQKTQKSLGDIFKKLKNPSALERVPMLKQMYEEEWQLAATEDRDRSNFKITPSTSYAW